MPNHRPRSTHRVKKYTVWCRSLDEESLLLKRPEMAERVQGRGRRYAAMKLVRLTPIDTGSMAMAFGRLLRAPLKDLLGGHDPDQFWQIHRGTMVNVKAIEAAERIDAGRMQVLLRGQHGKAARQPHVYVFVRELI